MPSIGSPKALITLPRKPSPTGIPARLPLLITRVPSFIPVSRPKRIHPISFLLISCTMPFTPVSKITISPYMAWSIPLIVTIPSPIQVTLPTSRLLVSKADSSISVFRMVMMSFILSAAATFSFMERSICCNLPRILQSYSSLPARIMKPPSRFLSSFRVTSNASAWHFSFRNSFILFNWSSVGGTT